MPRVAPFMKTWEVRRVVLTRLIRTFVVVRNPLLTQGYLWIAEVVAVAAVAFIARCRALSGEHLRFSSFVVVYAVFVSHPVCRVSPEGGDEEAHEHLSWVPAHHCVVAHGVAAYAHRTFKPDAAGE
jgi:hypothetical protein